VYRLLFQPKLQISGFSAAELSHYYALSTGTLMISTAAVDLSVTDVLAAYSSATDIPTAKEALEDLM
jgi:hypothetical protein